MAEKQSYFNIGQITDEFKKDLMRFAADPATVSDFGKCIEVWQVMTGLACAQQLAVISTTLCKIEKLLSHAPEEKPNEYFGDVPF